jgi:hypothetical protein
LRQQSGCPCPPEATSQESVGLHDHLRRRYTKMMISWDHTTLPSVVLLSTFRLLCCAATRLPALFLAAVSANDRQRSAQEHKSAQRLCWVNLGR